METIKGGRMEMYRLVMHQRNMDGDIDTERDLAGLVEAGVLVKVEPIPASVCDDPWNCCIHDPSDWGY